MYYASQHVFFSLLLFLAGPLAVRGTAVQSSEEAARFDVVVYGATPAGIAAAVSAARAGRPTLLVEETHHVGGLAAGGLSNTDFKTFESLGGLWREFMDRVVTHYAETYGAGSRPVEMSARGAYYEPRVAAAVFQDMLSGAGAEVRTRHRLVAVEMVPADSGRRRLAATRFLALALRAGRTVAIASDLRRLGVPDRRVKSRPPCLSCAYGLPYGRWYSGLAFSPP